MTKIVGFGCVGPAGDGGCTADLQGAAGSVVECPFCGWQQLAPGKQYKIASACDPEFHAFHRELRDQVDRGRSMSGRGLSVNATAPGSWLYDYLESGGPLYFRPANWKFLAR